MNASRRTKLNSWRAERRCAKVNGTQCGIGRADNVVLGAKKSRRRADTVNRIGRLKGILGDNAACLGRGSNLGDDDALRYLDLIQGYLDRGSNLGDNGALRCLDLTLGCLDRGSNLGDNSALRCLDLTQGCLDRGSSLGDDDAL
jgi:hypothetical protein